MAEGNAAVLSGEPESVTTAKLSGSALANQMLDVECFWLNEYRKGWQYGEQGVLFAAFERLENDIPPEERWAIEFGAGNGISSPVTVDPIARRKDWFALLIEPKKVDAGLLVKAFPPTTRVVQDFVTTEPGKTIDDFMERAGCPSTPAVMVVDIDSSDYHVVKGMKARPWILCVETLDAESPKQSDDPYVPTPDECGMFIDDEFGTQLQANAAAFDELMKEWGYRLIFRTRINSIYASPTALPFLRKKQVSLGCGRHQYPGFDGLDIKTGTDVRKLPYEDHSIDTVYASHVLEHFPYEDTADILKEWVRVLKPGGMLRLAVPDMRKASAALQQETPDDGFGYIQRIVCGSHTDENDQHRAMFVKESLTETMNKAGIGFVREFKPFMPEDCSNNPYSLNLEGIKRWWPRVEKPRVTLMLSQPRLTFTGHEMCLVRLAQKIDMDLWPACGAFWDRDMTVGTKGSILRYDPDFLLYSDYDSVFEESDVLTLLDVIQNDPTMAAIGAVQMSRHHDNPLVMETDLDYTTDLTKIRFHHFGLTIIRREVFEELEQPWFWSVPGRDKDGKWDWDAWARSDADITFWRNLERRGFNCYQHNRVCIGHIVQCVKYPCNRGRGLQLVPIENYWKSGKPKDAIMVPSFYQKKKPDATAATDMPNNAAGAGGV